MPRGISMTLCTAGLALLACQGAQAAVTVLGNGLAHNCYEYAEFGGNAKDGIATCNEALDQTALAVRDRAATLVNRGILEAQNGSPDLALADYDRGIALTPTLAEAYVDRGAALIALKRYEEAVHAIDQGIAMGTERPQIAYYDRGIADEALGNVRAAYEDYKKAVEIKPDFELATAQLAHFKVIRHRPDGT